MELKVGAREAAFLLDELRDIEVDESRHTSARHEARQLRKRTEAALTE